MPEAKKAVGKIKKKQWFEIIAPKIFRNNSLGETLVADRSQLIGKEVTTSLANITGEMKRQSTIIKFKVTELKENKALTEIIGYSILLTHIKRMVRKGRNKADLSFTCLTKDNKSIKVKVILITRSTTKNQVLTSLRKVGQDILTNSIKNISYSNLINDVIAYKLQRSLKEQLKKIFPLKVCEIRHISLISGKKAETEKKSEEVKPVKEEKPKEEAEKPEEKSTEKEEKKEKVKEDIKPKIVKEENTKEEEPKEVLKNAKTNN
jgi:small subunit ribosomal protein S3Ae